LLKKQIQGISAHDLSPEYLRINYLPAGFSGAIGAAAGFSGSPAGFSGAGAIGASAGFGASGFGVSAGLQPTAKTTNNINDNTKAITFFIKISPPSNNTYSIS
jgi:hypothetical protein